MRRPHNTLFWPCDPALLIQSKQKDIPFAKFPHFTGKGWQFIAQQQFAQ
jgi:hypothetical protein